MKILRQGHQYELPNFEKPDQPGQVIQFIEKEAAPSSEPGTVRTVNDGTTNEAVLEVLIDRLTEMGKKFPCRENAIVITKLEESLMWLNKRTADRKARGVEGKHLK